MSGPEAKIRLRARDFIKPPASCHVSHRRVQPGTTPPLHDHDFAEVFWIEAGRGAHILEGGAQPLAPGSLVLVAPLDAHGFDCFRNDGYVIFNVAFTSLHWNLFWQRYGSSGGDAGVDPFSRPMPARSYQLERSALAEVKRISAELSGGARTCQALDRFLLNLLHLLSQESALDSGFEAPAWLRKATATLAADKDLLEVGVRALVKVCGKSPEHLSRECRRWMGKTPTDVVNDLRLDEAASQLARKADSIVAVAQSVGFSNMSHFYRLFRARHRLTPADYRAAAQRVIQP